MTSFAFEVPHAHLEDFSDLQDFHFALSIHCNIKYYREYFRRQSIRGTKQVWLDNSFNETGKADQIPKLLKIADQIGAHKVVVPDDPNWPIHKIARRFKDISKFIPSIRAIVVVNSWLMQQRLIELGALSFALSYHVRLPWYHNGGISSYFEYAKDFHFLGLCNIQELKELHPPSCDTSVPIKLALQNISLRKWYEDGCPRVHHKPGENKLSYYDVRMTKKQIELARQNIYNLKMAVNWSPLIVKGVKNGEEK
jgi:hypothetical protein